MTFDVSLPRSPALIFPSRPRLGAIIFLPLALSLLAAHDGGAQQRPADRRPPQADTTGESDVYPVGDAVGVYRAILDLLYVDGRERPSVIIMLDTAQRDVGGPCSWKCTKPWPHKSAIDTATILNYTQQSWKRPRIIDFGYRIPIVRVSASDFERIAHDGYGYLAHLPREKVGPAEAYWTGFRRKYPKAWGRVMLGKVGFNPRHTEALIAVHQACGEHCNSFETVFLKRIGKEWRVIERVPESASADQTSGNLRYRGPAGAHPGQSQIVAIDASGSPPRPESDDAVMIYGAILDRLYSFYGESPREIVVMAKRAHDPFGLPKHRSLIDSTTVESYKRFAMVRDDLYPRFRYRKPIVWLSEESLVRLERMRAPAGEPVYGEPLYQRSDGGPPWMWDAFQSKYPGAWGYARLGRIGFNTAHTQALVVSQHFCGTSCVNTDTWFLERKNEVWYVVERMPGDSQQAWPPDGLRYLGLGTDPKSYKHRRVRVQFTDWATGKPLPNLGVLLVHHSSRPRSAKTDARGWVVLENPPMSGFNLKAKCPSKSKRSSVDVGGIMVSPGIDTTVTMQVDLGDCSQP
ncbi:MAG TPA: hypothetical protein VNO75_08345 [Gemmatimonadaceae bacterium]|nr:hypothetical protein [Gemmatimonadaceae bacterium]